MKNLGIYIHIPFCLRKCPYCDFYSVAEAQQGKSEIEGLRARFVKALCREIESGGRKYGMKARTGEARQVDTIYLGGGTPSLLMPHELEEIMDTVRKNFELSGNAEISMECNPATASKDKLEAYRRAGVNRLSIGAQSFDDGVLRTLGRLHNSADTLRTVEEARRAGFDNISLDLMFAIPGQTDEIWENTVRRAVMLNPQHISFYSLEFMEGTPFTDRLEKGEIRETEAEADRRMYERGLEIMGKAGFIQYEISNGALGLENVCRHNMKYWGLEEYLGFGPSAHSYMTGPDGRGIRFNNVSSIEKYLRVWENPEDRGQSAVEALCENSLTDDVCEYIFTGLRKNTGIDLKDFRKRFGRGIWEFYGEDVMKELEEYVDGGFAAVTDDNIRLTVKGMNISNRIMALFV
ncbi:MAG: radical SAM family heme chaperone HemW [Firmicutes bacterium]|nr:radical SAM family heme chaperone HemW [Bacillota bacterium]